MSTPAEVQTIVHKQLCSLSSVTALRILTDRQTRIHVIRLNRKLPTTQAARLPIEESCQTFSRMAACCKHLRQCVMAIEGLWCEAVLLRGVLLEKEGMGIGEEGMAAWGGPIVVYRILWTRIWRAIYSGLVCGALTIGLSVRRAAQLIKTLPVINFRVTIKGPFPVCWPATHVLAST